MRAFRTLAAVFIVLALPVVVAPQDKKAAPDLRVTPVLAEDGKPFVPGGFLNRKDLEDDRYIFHGSMGFRRKGGRIQLMQLDGATVRPVKGLDRIMQATMPGVIGSGDGVYITGDADDTVRGDPSRGIWWVKGASWERVNGLAASSYQWVQGTGCHVMVDGNATPAIYRLEGTKATQLVQTAELPFGAWKAAYVQKTDILVRTDDGKKSATSVCLHRCDKGKLTPLKFKDGKEVKVSNFHATTAGGSLLLFVEGPDKTESLWRYVSGAMHPVELARGKAASNVRALDVALSGKHVVIASRDAKDGPESAWVVGATTVQPVRRKDGTQLSGAQCRCVCAGDHIVFSVAETATDGVGKLYFHDGKGAEPAIGDDGEPLAGRLVGAAQVGKRLVVQLDFGPPGDMLFAIDGLKVIGPLCRPDGKVMAGSSLELITSRQGVYIMETLGATEADPGVQHLYWIALDWK